MLTAAFNYVAMLNKEKSFSKAAHNLGVSQPALSSAINRLEQSLGVMLFDRTSSPVRLTEAGVAYLEFCKNTQAVETEFRKKLSDIDNLKSGSLTVGGSSCFTSSYLPNATASFVEQHEGINIRIIDGRIPVIANMTLNGEIDLFITPQIIDNDELSMVKLLDERVFLCLPPQSPIRQQLLEYEVPLEDVMNGVCCKKSYRYPDISLFKKERFILLDTNQHIRQIADSYFSKHHFLPYSPITVNQMMTSYALTLSGIGLSFMTESSIRYGNFNRNAALYCFDSELSTRTLCAAYKKNGYLSKAAREYINILRGSLEQKL